MAGLWNYLLLAPPILLALTFHEYAHAYVAYRLGDDTAARQGRLTLNPLVHLDLLGTIMLFIIQLGWAKPVPVNPQNFKNPRQGMFWVAVAGPLSNIVLAAICGLLLRLFDSFALEAGGYLYLRMMLRTAVIINLILAFFNLIPIPPLDGSKVLFSFVPPRFDRFMFQLSRFGPFLLLAIILLGNRFDISLIWRFIGPPVRYLSLLFANIPM